MGKIKDALPQFNVLVRVKLSTGLEKFDFVNEPFNVNIPFQHCAVTSWRYPTTEELNQVMKLANNMYSEQEVITKTTDMIEFDAGVSVLKECLNVRNYKVTELRLTVSVLVVEYDGVATLMKNREGDLDEEFTQDESFEVVHYDDLPDISKIAKEYYGKRIWLKM